MRRNRGLSETDRAIWHAFAANITPSPGRAPVEAPIPSVPEPPPLIPAALLNAPPVPAKPAVPRRADPLTPGKHAGVDANTARRLTRGELNIDARLDLHGLTQEAAHLVLHRFVVTAQASGRRCVLIITGKGQRDGTGVLRSMIPRWLNEPSLRHRVVTLAEARPQHGGSGAFYLLLRRLRD